MPSSAIKSPVLTSHFHDNLAHERPYHENLTGKNMWLLVLREGSLRKQRSTLDALLWRPCRVVVRFLLLILIGLNGKSCTLFLSNKASLILWDM
jgi:hypothetical protein